MNRGSATRARAALLSGRCFNEAPIHESGKWARRGCDPRRHVGFNEAPIHESGKWGRHDDGTKLPWQASMRPRFMNRGSPEHLGAVVRCGQLQ